MLVCYSAFLYASGASLPVSPNLAPFDPKCPTPICNSQNLNMTWPVNNDPTKFWKCGKDFVPVQIDCQCGTYFYWYRQRCEFPWETPVLCDDVANNPPIKPPRECNETSPIIPPFNSACPVPDCSRPANLELLFPVRDDPTKFIQCGLANNAFILDCQCLTYFNWSSQRCEFIWHTTE